MVIDTHILLVQIVTKRPNREQHSDCNTDVGRPSIPHPPRFKLLMSLVSYPSDPQLNLQPSNAKVKVMSTILEGITKKSRSPKVSVLHPETLRSEKLCKRIVSKPQCYVPTRRFPKGRLTVDRCNQLTGLLLLINNIRSTPGHPNAKDRR